MSGLPEIQVHWIILGVIAYALVTAVLYTLAMQYRNAVRLHDLIRESKDLRSKYLAAHEAVQERQNRQA